MRIGVTGASGFVGSYLVKKLLEQKHKVVVLAHSQKSSVRWGSAVEVCHGSIEDVSSLESFCENLDVVYHLVGIIAETRKNKFDTTVGIGTKNLVEAAKKQKVKKIIYLSAVGTHENAKSKYHRTKFVAEQAVIASELPFVIFRPSIIYGKGDGFITMLEQMIRISPFLPIIGSGKYRMQPLYIDDLITMMTDCSQINNEIIEVGGPDKLEYLEILDILKRVLRKKRMNFFLPIMFMNIVSSVLEKILKPAPITRDQIVMM